MCPCPWGHLEVFIGVVSFEIDLNVHFTTYIFEIFTQPFGVGHHYMDGIVLVVVVWLLFAVVVVGVVIVLFFIFSLFSPQWGNLCF